MTKDNHADPAPSKPKRPSADEADRALQDVIEKELERGELNPGAEPDQKNEV